MAESTRERHLVAMGGGGLSTAPEDLPFDRYVLDLTGKSNPKVCFVPTASGDSLEYALRFHSCMVHHGVTPSVLRLIYPDRADLRSHVMEHDVIYVGGGNTKNLIALWKAWGLDEILREAWYQGIVLAGVSAGSICWFEDGITDSIPGSLTALKCLGFLAGSNCPHFDSEPGRRPTFHRLIGEGAVAAGYAADDWAALHYIGDQLEKVVSCRSNARAYRIEKDGDNVVETPLETTFLSKR
jgi:dipeptidase E